MTEGGAALRRWVALPGRWKYLTKLTDFLSVRKTSSRLDPRALRRCYPVCRGTRPVGEVTTRQAREGLHPGRAMTTTDDHLPQARGSPGRRGRRGLVRYAAPISVLDCGGTGVPWVGGSDAHEDGSCRR